MRLLTHFLRASCINATILKESRYNEETSELLPFMKDVVLEWSGQTTNDAANEDHPESSDSDSEDEPMDTKATSTTHRKTWIKEQRCQEPTTTHTPKLKECDCARGKPCKSRHRNNCRVCKSKTRHMCAECTLFLCGPDETGCPCWVAAHKGKDWAWE